MSSAVRERHFRAHIGQGTSFGGFFSSDPDVANKFARAFDQGAVYPVKLRMENPLIIDAKGAPSGAFQFPNIAQNAGTNLEYTQAFNAMRSGQYDGIILKNTADEGTVYIPLKSENIRSAYATFDPAKRNSSNLSAGIAGAAITGSALRALVPQEDQSKK